MLCIFFTFLTFPLCLSPVYHFLFIYLSYTSKTFLFVLSLKLLAQLLWTNFSPPPPSPSYPLVSSLLWWPLLLHHLYACYAWTEEIRGPHLTLSSLSPFHETASPPSMEQPLTQLPVPSLSPFHGTASHLKCRGHALPSENLNHFICIFNNYMSFL